MKYLEYYSIIKEQLDAQFEEERENIEKAAEYCSNSIMNERLVHVFGCGHSQMFAMEVFFIELVVWCKLIHCLFLICHCIQRQN